MDKLLEALKKALLEGGLEEGSDGFKKVLESKEFEGLKKQLEQETPKTFDEFLKLPDFKSEFDRRQTQAVQTRENNLREKYDFTEKGGKDPKGGNEESAEMKLIKELQSELKESKRMNQVKERESQARKLLKEKGIPSAFLKHFDLEGDSEIEAQVKGVEDAFNEARQELINANVKGERPPRGTSETKVTEDEARAVVMRMR